MSKHYDAIVIGGGVIGASTLFHLADLGCSKTLLLERGAIASGGTGRSCANMRTHYSILSNTELAVQSLDILRDFKTVLDDPDAESGYITTGYLILAGPGETASQLVDNLERQREHGANTTEVTPAEALQLHPLLSLDDVAAIGYEPDSGYADPHLTTTGFVAAARRRGAQIRTGTPVTEVITDGDEVQGVRTSDEEFFSTRVISAVGPWTQSITKPLGLDVPLETYRHTVLTFRGPAPYGSNLPVIKDLTVENKMYFRPESGTLLVGTGDSGDLWDDPDAMDGQPDPALVALQAAQVAHRVPSFAGAPLARSWFGPYDITPDWNPVVDEAPGCQGLYLTFGFSGHGFKLAPALGRAIAEMVLGKPTDIDISPYRFARFDEGNLLAGVYGAGSIS